jgi:hypothetical protein
MARTGGPLTTVDRILSIAPGPHHPPGPGGHDRFARGRACPSELVGLCWVALCCGNTCTPTRITRTPWLASPAIGCSWLRGCQARHDRHCDPCSNQVSHDSSSRLPTPPVSPTQPRMKITTMRTTTTAARLLQGMSLDEYIQVLA